MAAAARFGKPYRPGCRTPRIPA